MLSLFLPTKTDSPVLKLEGGIGENDNKREGGVGSKIQYIRAGGITFSFLFANWKSSGTDVRVQIFILNTTVFLSVKQ